MPGKYNNDPDLIDQIFELKKRIERLERAPRLGSSSVSGEVVIEEGGTLNIAGGILHMTDSEGDEALLIGGQGGDLSRPDGTPQPVFHLFRDDGTYVMTVHDAAPLESPYAQYWNLYDRDQNVVLGDDRVSGQGLARPYLPWRVVGKSQTETTTTASPSWDTMFTLRGIKQNPKLVATLSVTIPASTTGTVRLFHTPSSTVLAGPTLLLASTTTTLEWLADLASPTFLHMDAVNVEIQAQRNSGAGTISVQALVAYGRES